MSLNPPNPGVPPTLLPEARTPTRISSLERQARNQDSGTSRRVPVVPFVGAIGDRPTLQGQLISRNESGGDASLFFQNRDGTWWRITMVQEA